jgi:hypothetical protein
LGPHATALSSLQFTSQRPFTQLPTTQPNLGIGFGPHWIMSSYGQSCSHLPSTHMPIAHPGSGIGWGPQGVWANADGAGPHAHSPATTSAAPMLRRLDLRIAISGPGV